MIGIVDQRAVIDDVAGQQDAGLPARRARCRPANGRACGSPRRHGRRDRRRRHASSRRPAGAGRIAVARGVPAFRHAGRTSRRSRSGRQASIRCADRRGSPPRPRCTQRSPKFMMAADMVEMRVAGDADERALASPARTWRRRLTWPRPVSNSRSRSRPRTCQMLQRKNGLIQGSWISVTPSPMRMVSYQSASVDDRKRGHGSSRQKDDVVGVGTRPRRCRPAATAAAAGSLAMKCERRVARRKRRARA